MGKFKIYDFSFKIMFKQKIIDVSTYKRIVARNLNFFSIRVNDNIALNGSIQ